MKFKSTLVSISILLYLNSLSYSQSNKGRLMFQGNFNPFAAYVLGINKFKVQGDIRSGYFLLKNLVVGVNVSTYCWRNSDYNFFSLIPTGFPKVKGELFTHSLGFFLRSYCHSRKLVLFPELGAGYSNLSWKYDGKKLLSGWENYLYLKSGLGLNYFVNRNLALEVLASYRWNNLHDNPFSYYYSKNSVTANVGLSIFIP